MKKTLSQRFFLPLCLLTLFGILGGNHAWAAEETIVFANGTFASEQIVWEGTSCSITQTQGSSSSKVNSSYVSAPRWYASHVISFAAKTGYVLESVVVKATKNSYATALQSSTYSSGSSASVSGSVVTITTSGDFTIKMGAQSRISSIVVTYRSASTPYLNVTPSTLPAFPETEIGYSPTQKFTLSGNSLTADAVLAISGTNADMFSVSHSSITPTDGSISDTEVTVTYTPTEAGSHEATLTVSSTGATDQVIALSGTVVAPAANISPKVVYRKVTSTDDIVDGGVYLLFCESKGEAMSDITEATKYRISSVTATFSTDANGVHYYEGDVNVTGKPYEITVQRASNGTYNLLHANGKYINGKSDTDLGFSDTGSAGWSFYFVPATGNVQISNTGKAGNYLQRNGNGDYNYFKNYVGGQSTSQLYQKVGEISVAKAVDGYSTYVADFAYVMPAELKGYAVALAAKEDAIITELAYDAEAEVPSLTPLLIKTSETYGEEENVKTYYPAVLNKEVSAYSEDNYLEYQRAADGATTKTMKSGSVYYYKLTRNSEGKAGFYWGATNGAAFAMTKGSTAYLTVPQSMVLPIQGFVIDGNGETTGIDTVESETEKAAVYNLQGIRMTGAKLPKGVYISNGKKFMVK